MSPVRENAPGFFVSGQRDIDAMPVKFLHKSEKSDRTSKTVNR